jgi:hypothetical protein
VAKAWLFDHNWRETKRPEPGPQTRGWIPPSPGDVLRERIDGVGRDAGAAGYLRPLPGSDLATHGAGVVDPALPRWVGALPPEGVEPWDWERTWGAKLRQP